MPIVSGFVVPKMNPTSHVGNIRLLRPVVLAIEYQVDNQTKNAEPNGKEEPNEILREFGIRNCLKKLVISQNFVSL